MSPAAGSGSRWAWLRERLDRVGPFSPFATRGIFSPAARRLVAQAEGGAERVLHLLRLFLVLAGTAIGLFGFGLAALVGAARGLIVFAIVAVLALWLVIWRALVRDGTTMGLRAALVLFDGFAIDRGVLLVQNPGGIYSRIAPDVYRAVSELIRPSDVQAIAPPMLVLLAFSGALRLDPRLALLSTATALAVYTHLRLVIPAPPGQVWVTGLVIAFAGLLGASAARVFRFVTWKASQEQVLERYVPAALTSELGRSGDPERAGRIETISVLVADIRGFTRLSERLCPEEAVALLNASFAVMVAPIARAGGLLDKYIGDGLLAFFEGADHAGRALRAALDMLAAIEAFNVERGAVDPLRIGVAVHSGDTLVGTVGAQGRRDYTIIGDVVNVTARLEELNKHLDACLVVSEATIGLVGDADAIRVLAGPTVVELRGREASVRVHHLARDAGAAQACAKG